VIGYTCMLLCGFPACAFRAADRGCEVSTRPSLRPLGQEGGEINQSSGEMRREDEKLRVQVRFGCDDGFHSRAPDAAQRSCGALQSRGPCRDMGPCRHLDPGSALQRFALQLVRDMRDEIVRKVCAGSARGIYACLTPGSPRARGRDVPRSWDGRGCARNWCRAVRSPRARPGRDTNGT
jgi:hypothetical protein